MPSRNTDPSKWEARYQLVVLAVAALVFLGTIASPPSLMDEVDAAHAQIARTMVETGDWATPRLNGIVYHDKTPMAYWMAAASFTVFGVHDWAARIPFALAAMALCWLTARFAAWSFGSCAGLWAGLGLATSIGLFLFTRILIPDAALTLCIAAALWSLQRTLDHTEKPSRLWPAMGAAAIGVGLLLKGVIALIFPLVAGLLWLWLTGQLFEGETWRRLRPLEGVAIAALIAAPWYALSVFRNPPYFDVTLHSEPGVYRGFFWRYFVNEHVLRYLGLRYPKDYGTVPLAWFWLGHLVWLFPWTGFLAAAARLPFRARDRASQTRLLAVCWIGAVLLFFSFSTSQEYYSLPCYPAFALLIGAAAAREDDWSRAAAKLAGGVALVAALACAAILIGVRGAATPGDIAEALSHNPGAYTLSLGHMHDLTFESFAYLRTPLALAVAFFGLGAFALVARYRLALALLVLMMTGMAHAARLAMVEFDPYLSSRPIAGELKRLGAEDVAFAGEYYAFSSAAFYAGLTRVLLVEGRFNQLEYGSHAPGAPDVFMEEKRFASLWNGSRRAALICPAESVPRWKRVLGEENVYVAATRGGKALLASREPPD